MGIKVDSLKLTSETRAVPPADVRRPVAIFDVVFDNGRVSGFWLHQVDREWFIHGPDGKHFAELPEEIRDLAVAEFMRIATHGR